MRSAIEMDKYNTIQYNYPKLTAPNGLSSLAVTGLGAPLSSVLKRRYISLQNE